MAKDDRRGWGEGPLWMVPGLVVKRSDAGVPFFAKSVPYLRRVVDRRTARLDHSGSMARVLGIVVVAAHAETGILHNPSTGRGYLGLKKLAELACTSITVTKRVMRALRNAGVLIFTKHLREKDEATGKHKSLGPSIRRLSWKSFFAMFDVPAELVRVFKGWLDSKARKREREAQREAERRRAALAAHVSGANGRRKPLPPLEAMPKRLTPEERAVLMGVIHAEHPEWNGQQIAQELLRREAAAPPKGGPSEPETSDGPAPKS